MMNLFQASVSDQSLTYLYTIFGSMNGVIPMSGTQASSGSTLTLLGAMFKTFNSVVLAVGALIVVYVTVVGVMDTAHEGQAMGKEWNNMWIPIRIVLGIASLVPTGSGYSGIQIVMMWVIIQGIGAADTLWGTALQFISAVGSPYAQVTPPTTQVRQSLRNLFKGMLCYQASAATFKNVYPEGGPDNAYFCNPQSGNKSYCGSINSSSFTPNFSENTPFVLGPTGACGTLVYCDVKASCTTQAGDKNVGPDSLSCKTCKAQHEALTDIVPMFSDVAKQYIDVDYKYTQYFFTIRKIHEDLLAIMPVPAAYQGYCTSKNIRSCTVANLPSPLGDSMSAPTDVIDNIYWPIMKETLGNKDFINTAVAFYQDKITGVLATYMQTQINNPDSKMKGLMQQAQDNGWILAGSYYLMLARSNSSNLQASMPSLTFETNTENLPTTTSSPLYKYRNDFKAAARIAALASGSASGGGGNEVAAEGSEAASQAAGDAAESMNTLVNSTGTDPLTQLSATGYTLIAIATILIIVFIILVLIIGTVSHISFMWLGSGLTENPFGAGINAVLLILMPLFFFFIGLMLSIGATLAIYIPLIPYTIFTIGAIGWMLSTIEAMVAGPLVALGVLVPSGHHKLLGKAEPALMLLFNIFLRPSLMIFGLFAAILLSGVVLRMINTGFATVFLTLFDFANTSATDTGGGGVVAGAFNPVALIFVLVFYVTLITTSLNKTFSAIHVIPENVMRWIGGQGERYGEEGALGEVKQAISGAASKSSEGLQASGQVASGAKKGADDKAASGKGNAASVTPTTPPKKGP